MVSVPETSRPGLCLPNPILKGLKRGADDADHSPAISAKVKNDWNYSSPPLIHLHGVKRDIFHFLTSVLFVFISIYISTFF